MRARFALLLFFATIASLAHATGGETSPRKADILGGVYNHDSKKPLSSVAITIYRAEKKEKVIFTDAAGLYTFDDLQAGTYKFVFEKDGYKRVTRDRVVVLPDAGVHLNIEMTKHTLFEFFPGPFHFSDFE